LIQVMLNDSTTSTAKLESTLHPRAMKKEWEDWERGGDNNSNNHYSFDSNNNNIYPHTSWRQRLWSHANHVLAGVLIIASVVSNVRAITLAIVSNCLQQWQSRRQKSHHYSHSHHNHPRRTPQPQDYSYVIRRLTSHCFTWRALGQVALASLTLLIVPLLLWRGVPEHSDTVYMFIRQCEIVWDALLHIRIWPIVVTIFIRSLFVGHAMFQAATLTMTPTTSTTTSSSSSVTTTAVSNGSDECNGASSSTTSSPAATGTGCESLKQQATRNFNWSAFTIGLAFFLFTVLGSQLQIILPSWLWNPFLWGRLRVYYPQELSHLMQGMCLDYDPNNVHETRPPLCLSPHSWQALSVEALDSHNPSDVAAVMKGIHYARDESGGMIINIMSRDTVDAIEPLRHNVEALLPFFPGKLAVVVFENDSQDGSREAFKAWAASAQGYTIDLMSCGDDHPDCKFGVSHRYDATEEQEYFRSSAIGKMADFRQTIVDYVIQSPKYTNYSHMIVLDLDLQVNLSPLGVMHTLGTVPNAAVASAGRQVWPGSMGTLVPPYDFSAYRFYETPTNKYLLSLHKQFCELLPSGDRWRNQCDAVSAMHLMMILSHDRFYNEPYPVASAFNGATMYPLQLVKETHATYDSGDDGQRCEHIGFNLALGKPMYVNPKWTFHVSPLNPGGPTGRRALRNILRIVFTLKLSLAIGVQNAVCMVLFVYSVMILGVYLFFPVIALVWLVGCRRSMAVLGKHHSHEASSSMSLPTTFSGRDAHEFRMMPMLQPYSSKRTVKHI